VLGVPVFALGGVRIATFGQNKPRCIGLVNNEKVTFFNKKARLFCFEI
jgi:hypothetical protein